MHIVGAMLLAVVVCLNVASAAYPSNSLFTYNTYQNEFSNYNTQYPQESFKQIADTHARDTNFDSSSTNYDYRGPLYEKTSFFTDSYLEDHSTKSGFFTSKSKNIVSHVITNAVTEKYVGSTESLYQTNQNRRLTTNDQHTTTDHEYDGGLSFGSQRLYDNTEYRESYREPYYYRPILSPRGSYSWHY